MIMGSYAALSCLTGAPAPDRGFLHSDSRSARIRSLYPYQLARAEISTLTRPSRLPTCMPDPDVVAPGTPRTLACVRQALLVQRCEPQTARASRAHLRSAQLADREQCPEGMYVAPDAEDMLRTLQAHGAPLTRRLERRRVCSRWLLCIRCVPLQRAVYRGARLASDAHCALSSAAAASTNGGAWRGARDVHAHTCSRRVGAYVLLRFRRS